MTMGQGLYGLPDKIQTEKKPSRSRTAFWVVVTIAFLISASLFMLMKAGGNSDSLKATIEDVISEMVQARTTIGTLNAASFYPVVGIDVDDVRLSRSGPEGESEIVSLRHGNYATGFWSVIFGRSEFRSMVVQDLSASAGVLLPRALWIKTADLGPDVATQPRLMIEGAYGGQPIKIALDMEARKGLGKALLFRVAKTTNLTFSLGEIAGDIDLKDPQARKTDFTVHHLKAMAHGRDIQGKFTLEGTWTGLRMHGDATIGKSPIQFDLTMVSKDDRHTVTGTVDAKTLDMADITGAGGLRESIRAIFEFYNGAAQDNPQSIIPIKGLDMDVKVQMGESEKTLTLKDGILVGP